ncbi:MAG: AAA family ATPase [Lachnospiraceae bacterium]|nr:AAA family ATPase [Lachnospiraceae bacterium]
MKIRVAVLDMDLRYLNKIISFFNNQYSDKVEIFGFSDEEVLLKEIKNMNVDILLLPHSLAEILTHLPDKTAPVFMVEGHDVSDIGEYATVCKYQKASNIYKKLLAVYSENTEYEFVNNAGEDVCRMIAFCNVAGGVGNTTVALAYAMKLAASNRRVFYMDLQAFSKVSVFLSGDVQESLSNVLYSIKSKKKNVWLSIESSISRDVSGIDYLKETTTALDLLEMTDDEASVIMDELVKSELYDYILVDVPFALSGYPMNILKKAQKIIWVSNGTNTVNGKLLRAFQAVSILDEQKKTTLSARTRIVYNGFSSRTGKIIDEQIIKNMGGIPKFANGSERQIVEQIQDIEVLRNMVEEL